MTEQQAQRLVELVAKGWTVTTTEADHAHGFVTVTKCGVLIDILPDGRLVYV